MFGKKRITKLKNIIEALKCDYNLAIAEHAEEIKSMKLISESFTEQLEENFKIMIEKLEADLVKSDKQLAYYQKTSKKFGGVVSDIAEILNNMED